MKEDHYKLLGVSRDATSEQIKKAFREKALEFHPDRNKDENADTKFKEANEAYNVLSDPEKRATYDQFGHDGLDSYGRRRSYEDIFDGFGNIFGEMFGSSNRQRRQKQKTRGRNIESSIQITLKDSALGKKVILTIPRTVKCNLCNGNGCASGHSPITCSICKGGGYIIDRQAFITIQQPCPSCKGLGNIIKNKCKKCVGMRSVSKKDKIKVSVPPGISNGMTIRLSRKGEFPAGADVPGDLHLKVIVKKHKLFQRHANNIHYTLPLNFSTACLGGDVIVPTLYGDCELHISESTPSETTLILKNKGCPSLNNKNKIGDQHVKVIINIPDKLSEEEKKLIKELKNLGNI